MESIKIGGVIDRARDHRSFDEKFGNSWFVDLEEGETNETEREREWDASGDGRKENDIAT